MRKVLFFDEDLVQLRGAVVALLATLLAFGFASWLRIVAHLNVDVAVLAVVLTVTLSRSYKSMSWKSRSAQLVELVVVSVLASRVGGLITHHQNIGDVLFVLAMSGAVFVRKFGPQFVKLSSVISLPFIAALVTPVPAPPGNSFALWAAPVAAMAYLLVFLTHSAAAWVRFLPNPMVATAPASRPSNRRVSAFTSMALQMLVSLSVAFVVGRSVYGEHWTWVVLTTYIVASGNRGRADVIYKGVLRVFGALVGTLAASLLAGVFARGDKTAVVVIFVLLGVAMWLRTANYAYWAGCVTAALAFLYGYFGQNGTTLLDERLGGVLLGGLLAIAAAWFIFPVKTTDVLRRRQADALAALTEFLIAFKKHDTDLVAPSHALHVATTHLWQIAPPLRVWRFVARGRGRHGFSADKLDAIKRCALSAEAIAHAVAANPSLVTVPELAQMGGVVLDNVVAVRRAMKERSVPALAPLTEASEGPVAEAFVEINAALTVL